MYDAFIRVLLCVCMRVFIDTYLYVYMTCSCIVLVVVALPFESVIIVRCCTFTGPIRSVNHGIVRRFNDEKSADKRHFLSEADSLHPKQTIGF